jgi:hypothetical protein
MCKCAKGERVKYIKEHSGTKGASTAVAVAGPSDVI